MICRRRIPRNPVVILLILVGVTFYLIKTGNISLFTYTYDLKQLEGKASKEHISSFSKSRETNDPSLIEVERLKQESNNLKIDNFITYEEIIRKYNESLRLQKEKEDPFKKSEDVYTDFLNFQTSFSDTKYTAEQLRPVIADLNQRRLTYNADKFPLHEDHPVVVVQVHKRITYFKELLDSLQRANGIENILLVISHDFYLDSLNALIRQIKFCQVIQIFFPYSLQLYPNQFPGQGKKDCPRDMPKSQAISLRCENAEHPDQYGHYREAHVTMIKHHWWWKINMVFDELLATKKHQGPVLFMEEDHYVAPSFYESLLKLHQLKQRSPQCTESCEILTLGSYSKNENYETHASRVLHGVWVSTQHNMGMAMYRSTWQKIKICAAAFCTFDDYNWDWTLMHLSKTCIGKVLTVLDYDLPRVFHIGDCGLHHTKSCNSKDTLNKVKRIIRENKDYLFPDHLNIVDDQSKHYVPKPNGGWGDVRDHELCLSFVKPDVKLIR